MMERSSLQYGPRDTNFYEIMRALFVEQSVELEDQIERRRMGGLWFTFKWVKEIVIR